MSKYLLFESQDSFSTHAVHEHVELAAALKRAGNEVTLYFAQNGVLPCRSGADGETLHEAIAAGIEVLADDYCRASAASRMPTSRVACAPRRSIA